MAVTLNFPGSLVAGNTQVRRGGGFYVVDATATNPVTLPKGEKAGDHFFIAKSGASAVTLTGAAGDTVTGTTTVPAAGVSLHVQYINATTVVVQ